MKTVAVLIPSFKPGKHVERCFESLNKQTLDKEYFTVYIALNGPREGYEDFLKETLRKYSFRFEYFYIPMAGVSNARNKLIEHSTEPYIVFLDDDDYVSENYLQELVKEALPKSIVVSNVYDVDEHSGELLENYLGRCFEGLSKRETSKFRSREYFSTACAKIVPRYLISNVRFDNKLDLGEDSLFMAEISSRVNLIIKSSAEACYYRILRSGSASRSKPNKIKELKRLFYLLKKYTGMLTKKKYERAFIVSRIVATLLHVRRFVG